VPPRSNGHLPHDYDGPPEWGAAAVPAKKSQPEATGITFVLFDDMRPRLGDGYLVKGLLGSGAMAVMYGESGSGKTFLALHLGLCVAGGNEFFGHRVRQAGVVYIAAEAGKGIETRVAAAKHEFEFPGVMPFAAIEAPLDLCGETGIGPLIAAINGLQLGMKIEMIVIDTLSRVMAGGNENQPDHMGAFVANVDRLRAETAAAVVVVHHSGKDASRGARGHSLLRAATDTEIEVTRDAKISTARVTKQRELPADGAFAFALRSVELGHDTDGDAVTSCVVEEAGEATGASVQRDRALPPAQRRALELLAEAINQAGEVPAANNHIPAHTRCVTEAAWREYCYLGAISAGCKFAINSDPLRGGNRVQSRPL
jgi:AAA domain-containing protein